jgi:cyclophilin family peptidyl-prolyl cis-trans isomerase
MRGQRSAVWLGLGLVLAGVPPQRAILLDPGSEEFSKPAPARAVVLLETSKGNLRLELIREWAPHGADRFYNLVRVGYYDGAKFFRIRPGTWVQFGIAGDPAVARAWRTRTIPDDALKEPNVRGTVAFAFKDPNGRTTQVFVNLRDNRETHDKEFVPFARVIEGMAVADALYAEYGEQAGGGIRAGKQDPLFEGGNAFLEKHFPRLDFIVRADFGAVGARTDGLHDGHDEDDATWPLTLFESIHRPHRSIVIIVGAVGECSSGVPRPFVILRGGASCRVVSQRPAAGAGVDVRRPCLCFSTIAATSASSCFAS